ncbi:MAG: RNA-binding domain-containing protein [Candidatus Methanodesulfokora washburnensis]|jgi:ATP-dependent DNA helicase RecG
MTGSDRIKKIIAEGESEGLEFKRSLSELKEILETVCAFANSHGGTVLVGIDDDGSILGVKISNKTVQKLEREIHDRIEPFVYPKIRIIPVDERIVLSIEVPEGHNKPYLYLGRAFVRIGSVNRRLDREGIEKLLYSKRPSFDSLSFEERADIDEGLLKELVGRARERRGMEIEYTNLADVLAKLNLADDKGLKNGAVLLFSPDASFIFPQAVVKLRVVRDGKVVDEDLITGPIIRQVDRALDFIKRNISKGYIIRGSERVEMWEYPIKAVREAIVNAIVHRDYSSTSTVQITIKEDSLEVINPGGLPPQLKPEDLKREHPSIPRNPRIARVFYLWGFLEEWGSGTTMMIDACREAGLPDPEFSEEWGFMRVLFRSKKYVEKLLNEGERRALELIRVKGVTTREEVQRFLGVSEKTARRYLSKLVDLGLVRVEGRGKNIKYRLAEAA